MWSLLTPRRSATVLSHAQLLRVYNHMVTLRARGHSKAYARNRVNWEVLHGQWF